MSTAHTYGIYTEDRALGAYIRGQTREVTVYTEETEQIMEIQPSLSNVPRYGSTARHKDILSQ